MLTFGPFVLLPRERLLLENGESLRLGSRALDILIVLAERAGELVSREELIALVWPDTFVEEANLRVHIGALRKVLGESRAAGRYIINVPGRGYCFVARVHCIRDAPAIAAPVTAAALQTAYLPAPLTRMIGRADSVSAVAARLQAGRLVTIAGPGGIGKTTVALAVAHGVAHEYAEHARFVDLAALVDPLLLADTLAAALGLPSMSGTVRRGILAHLRDKQLLLVLDNCEHVIDAVAALAEDVLKAAPDVRVLATSREPLGAAGECVHRLVSLACPPEGVVLTAGKALRYPAIELFVERTMAGSDAFVLADAETSVVADICRRLDGIPLAIELAAATVDLFGLRGLASRLDDRFALLTKGRRTALPRHRTLRATLDWSYDILSEPQQVVLRRLSAFAGAFTQDGANAVAGAGMDTRDVADSLTDLAAKSLLSVDVSSEAVTYRLQEITRAYALEKLKRSGEYAATFHRHAQHCCDLLCRENAALEGPLAPRDRPRPLVRHIDDIRLALSWALGPGGNTSLGVALAAAAVPLWMDRSLMQECRIWASRALAARPLDDDCHSMQLHSALGFALIYTQGVAQEKYAALRRALTVSEQLENVDYQLRALWGLSIDRLNNGLFREALVFAERFCRIAQQAGDRAMLPIGDRTLAVALHYLGESSRARRHLERMLDGYPSPTPRAHAMRFPFDLRVTAQLVLAEILWIQGSPHTAMTTVRRSIGEALALDHSVTLCNALAKAIPVALMIGDLDAAAHYVDLLLDHSARGGLASWQAEARCYQCVLWIRRGKVADGLTSLRTTLEDLPALGFSLRYAALLGELAAASASAGELVAGLAAIDAALLRAERNDERWCLPELLRTKGELLQRRDAPDADAEVYFQRALTAARQAGALSWELRAATSLAGLRITQHRTAEAYELLAGVYGRFSEGLETSDLRAARALLLQMPA